MEKQETVYYCKQGEPTCVYPKCVCNAARPKEEPKEETLENFLYQYWFDSQTMNENNQEVFIDGGLIGAKWKAERMVSKEAYQDSLNMQKASNQGYESKIAELKERISKMYSNEEVLDIISKIVDKLQFYFSDNLKGQIVGELFNKFKKK